MFCAPGIKGKHHTCFDRSALLRIINAYNQQYPNRTIKPRTTWSDTQLWDIIRQRIAELCGGTECSQSERMWLDQPFIKGDLIIQNYYKPPKPDKPRKWLSTNDINAVLKQYENMYSNFAFMGTVPIDFDQVIDEYARMNLCSLYKGEGLNPQIGGQNSVGELYVGRQVRRFGFVFNLDPHDQSGSHWVCMFLDLTATRPYVGFFDSYGQCPPPPEVVKLMNRLKEQTKNCLGLTLIKKCNPIRHQHKGTECGVYCLYFIYQCLQGIPFERICEQVVLDDTVNRFRDFFFRPIN